MAKQRLGVLSVALILVLAAGCGGRSSSVPHGPQTGAGGVQGAHRAARDNSSSSGGLFHPNSEKYQDAGAHPATGRSGSAQVQSRALLAKDGSVLVEATTGVLDGAPGPGYFTKVQTKLFGPDGSLQQTQNDNHVTTGSYWSQTFPGLIRNENVQLDTHVKGIDGHRTDVVTTVDAVKLRPDLAVRSLTGPPQAYVNTSVVFQAVIAELNHDVGARANCVLSVDGTPVDQAVAIWVDAGQSVTCMFAYTFSTTGAHTVSVAVVNVVPADFDPSNNTAQTTIQIVQPSNLAYQASIATSGYQQTTYDTLTGQFSGYSDNSTFSDSSFSAFMYAYTPNHTFVFPVQSFAGSVTIDGTVAWQPTFTNQLAPPVSDGNSTCQNQYSDGAFGTVCVYNSGLSAASWYGTTTSVTYYSSHTDYTCTGGTCTSNQYILNNTSYTYGTGAPNLNIGTTQQLGLTLVDGSATPYAAQTLVMSAPSSGYTFGYDTCENFQIGSYCFGSHGTVSNKSAFDSGPGDGT
jgi:hypothetical protein